MNRRKREIAKDGRPIIDVGYKRHWLIRWLEKIIILLLDLGLWGFLLYEFYVYFIVGSYRGVAVHTMEGLFLAGILILLVLSGWQYYNWFLFHGKDRRRAFQRQSLAEVARLYGMEEQDMEVLQSSFRRADVFCRDGVYYYQPEGKDPVRIGMLSEAQSLPQKQQEKVHQPL